MRNILTLFVLLLISQTALTAQTSLPDSCRLSMGINISGLSDYMSEMPFVDVMRHCRTWFTYDSGNPNSPWDTEASDSLQYRPDGYPTHAPQTVPGHTFPQGISTVWGYIQAWPTGTYVCLFEGTGQISFFLSVQNVTQTGPGRITFNITNPQPGDVLGLRITQSDSLDPIRNIRVLMPGTEFTYQSQPFNPLWLQRLQPFGTVRFMDWGQTNGWGCNAPWPGCATDTQQYPWSSRARMNDYTWANMRGVPYEMMIRLCNETQKDLWICVPHSADSQYIASLATLIRDSLDPQLRVCVEYSNEIWNWMFNQTHYLHNNGDQNVPWPERIVPYVQRTMDIFTSVFAQQSGRLTRVVCGQAGWLDVSQRIAWNMQPGSFDAFSVAAYFGLSQSSDSILDVAGPAATAQQIATMVRTSRMQDEWNWLLDHKTTIADSLGVQLYYYEGGQHITPHPFGVPPTYAQALLDIQRDTAMYNLYTEWFDSLRTLVTGPTPALLMNFSFIGQRSAQYGSWGMLETLAQDTAVVPAPKYRAILENIHPGCGSVPLTVQPPARPDELISVFPNPASDVVQIKVPGTGRLQLLDVSGRVLLDQAPVSGSRVLQLPEGAAGLYLIRFYPENESAPLIQKLVVQPE
ncbi:MAG: T9SS type A sorting domain-containing protein [Bacteroidia bacterium]|jgi:hypothetical protein|nr:T9SS type A sorting domain-containing protein [Bacteroidia bacterium]